MFNYKNFKCFYLKTKKTIKTDFFSRLIHFYPRPGASEVSPWGSFVLAYIAVKGEYYSFVYFDV